MSTRYFALMGSPRSRQVLGPHRLDHHAGWLEIDGFTWIAPSGAGGGGGGAGKARFSQLEFSRTADSASMRLFLHCHAGEGFDLVLVDIWDEQAQRSKTKFELLDVMISSCTRNHDRAIFTLDFADMSLIPAGGAKSAAISPAMIKMALARTAT
jgi:type VI protein secretion system component Hcp